MIKTFTPDDLLRYLYEDTSVEESKEIEIALLTDERLQEEWEQLQNDFELLDNLLLEPSGAVTDRIMHWAGAMNMAALKS
jgi:RecB family exonuclease